MSDVFTVKSRVGTSGAMELVDKVSGRTVWSSDAAGSSSTVYAAVFTATVAQINTGLTIVAADANRTLTVVGFHLMVTGAMTTSTDVRLSDTSSGPVDIVTVVVAGLYSGAVITPGSAVLVSSPPELNDVTVGAGFAAALTAGKGIQIRKTGGTLAGGTSITGVIQYILA